MNNWSWIWFAALVIVIASSIAYANYKFSKVEKDSNERILKILGYTIPSQIAIVIVFFGLGFLFEDHDNS